MIERAEFKALYYDGLAPCQDRGGSWCEIHWCALLDESKWISAHMSQKLAADNEYVQ